MDIVLSLVGLVILLFSGDFLVRGAVALSVRMGLPPMIVGLTVVAFGTSAPELLIGIQAALDGFPDIALGNVVGSNIANILLVLGAPALISTVPPTTNGSSRNYLQMVMASVLLIVLCVFGPLHFWHAAILLGLFALMMADMVRSGRRQARDADTGLEGFTTRMPTPRMSLFLVLGLIGLPLGAKLLIDGSVAIARDFGLSEAVIGLTLVAIGTSLPELATTVMAAIRKEADVAIGNVLGSNLFNILSILGITSLFGPIPVGAEFLSRDLWVMLACALLLGPFVMMRRRIGRTWGVVFLVLYGGYVAVLLHVTGG